ncbi:hypothetical protein Misp01_36470 [Microtetraspora sp. NBRC 13810]|nr:hypothetical protein Misp01_36470 [Microtetraspora sp. NBRC 13810]
MARRPRLRRRRGGGPGLRRHQLLRHDRHWLEQDHPGNSGATITGCGLNVSRASNVIIRNLTFRGWNDDAINVQYSIRVWIDHNTLSDGYEGAVTAWTRPARSGPS